MGEQPLGSRSISPKREILPSEIIVTAAIAGDNPGDGLRQRHVRGVWKRLGLFSEEALAFFLGHPHLLSAVGPPGGYELRLMRLLKRQ
jgi:hypothetical protein